MTRYLSAFFLAVLLCACLEGLAFSAQGNDERILSFDSHITVQPDSILTVTETIRVRSAGDEIKHGIFRDFPTVYRDAFWNFSKRGFRVTGVTRDGRPEKYETQWLPNGWRVLIGDSGVLLETGEHTYVITYRTNRQLGYFKDHDELYWNVTGNDWHFPIDKATATVELPAGASGKILSVEGYTGLQGEKGKKLNAGVAPGLATFSTTGPLDKFEGLTIVVTWPQGSVKAPSTGEKIRYFVRDNQDAVWGLGGLIAVFAYFLIAWFRVGRDPAGRSIVPEYGAPGGLSPAAVRFISKMGYDDKTFGAAVIDMAVKKALKITEKAGNYTLRKIQGGPAALAPEEGGLLADIFDGRDVLGLSTGNYAPVARATDNLKDILKTSYEKSYFKTNRAVFYPGLALSALAVIISSYHNETINLLAIPAAFFACVLPLIVLAALRKAAGEKRRERWNRKRGSGFGALMQGGLIVWYSLLLVVFTAAGAAVLAWKTSSLFSLFLVGTVGLNYPFFHLLKAPTREGALLMDKIRGFRVFLGATEEGRLNRMNPPDMTPELFERFLPYALALDVEQAWAEQFSDILKESGYEPQWYSGTIWDSTDMSRFSSSLGSSLAASIASASTPPGSSSGSGGSGSSGGGGGGGGGGGW
jgi:uncharacterized membrane protein YgcG